MEICAVKRAGKRAGVCGVRIGAGKGLFILFDDGIEFRLDFRLGHAYGLADKSLHLGYEDGIHLIAEIILIAFVGGFFKGVGHYVFLKLGKTVLYIIRKSLIQLGIDFFNKILVLKFVLYGILIFLGEEHRRNFKLGVVLIGVVILILLVFLLDLGNFRSRLCKLNPLCIENDAVVYLGIEIKLAACINAVLEFIAAEILIFIPAVEGIALLGRVGGLFGFGAFLNALTLDLAAAVGLEAHVNGLCNRYVFVVLILVLIGSICVARIVIVVRYKVFHNGLERSQQTLVGIPDSLVVFACGKQILDVGGHRVQLQKRGNLFLGVQRKKLLLRKRAQNVVCSLLIGHSVIVYVKVGVAVKGSLKLILIDACRLPLVFDTGNHLSRVALLVFGEHFVTANKHSKTHGK